MGADVPECTVVDGAPDLPADLDLVSGFAAIIPPHLSSSSSKYPDFSVAPQPFLRGLPICSSLFCLPPWFWRGSTFLQLTLDSNTALYEYNFGQYQYSRGDPGRADYHYHFRILFADIELNKFSQWGMLSSDNPLEAWTVPSSNSTPCRMLSTPARPHSSSPSPRSSPSYNSAPARSSSFGPCSWIFDTHRTTRSSLTVTPSTCVNKIRHCTPRSRGTSPLPPSSHKSPSATQNPPMPVSTRVRTVIWEVRQGRPNGGVPLPGLGRQLLEGAVCRVLAARTGGVEKVVGDNFFLGSLGKSI